MINNFYSIIWCINMTRYNEWNYIPYKNNDFWIMWWKYFGTWMAMVKFLWGLIMHRFDVQHIAKMQYLARYTSTAWTLDILQLQWIWHQPKFALLRVMVPLSNKFSQMFSWQKLVWDLAILRCSYDLHKPPLSPIINIKII